MRIEISAILGLPEPAGQDAALCKQENMEIKRRMSRRCAWVLAVVVLLAIATLVACSSTYSASNDGLVLVPSAGSAVVQAFSFSLTNGHVSLLNTAPSTLGQPTAMLLDPTGSFAYATTVPNGVGKSLTGSAIVSYSVKSDGTLTGVGSTPICTAPCSVMPVALAMDSLGKFLFVSEGLTASIAVFSIGSGGSLTSVGGVTVPTLQNGINANLVGLAVTPTKYPALNTQSVQNAVCSLGPPLPASAPEYLYVADANNNVVWGFTVQSGGILSPIVNPLSGVVLTFPADSVTTGVAVDPCNRFVFATNNNSNTVSAYAICNATSPARPPICDANQYPDGYLVQVAGSPFNLGGGTPNGPTVAAVDPLANFLYVLGNKSNTISCFRISQVNGTLAPLTPATIATGINPAAIAIRGDDNWLFVANNDTVNGFGIVSQYEITPASGVLTPFGTGIQTDNYPTAIAVK
jgi:6-phosphogluconolactonase (cycloisomerase 2 family)